MGVLDGMALFLGAALAKLAIVVALIALVVVVFGAYYAWTWFARKYLGYEWRYEQGFFGRPSRTYLVSPKHPKHSRNCR